MKARALCILQAALLIAFAVASAPAVAGPPAAPAEGIVIDCANPVLPGQREVGELLGQRNFSQVYDSRTALMAAAHRACHRKGARYARLTRAKPTQPAPEAKRVAYEPADR